MALKAGYNIRMRVDKKNPVKTPVKFYVAKHQTVHVEDAYIAQHEYEDKAILTPEGIAGCCSICRWQYDYTFRAATAARDLSIFNLYILLTCSIFVK